MHKSITQFSELVRHLSSRSGAEHVPWRGGKLTTLLGTRLGRNAHVRCIATVKSGSARQTAATLEVAAKLRDVMCYPVVNSSSALGLASIARSEMVALRSDLEVTQV